MKQDWKMINIPILNDFIYTVLHNMSFEDKRKLEGRFLRAASNGTAAKTFAAKSTREEKEYLLTQLGYQFTYIIYQKSDSFERIKKLITSEETTIRILQNLAGDSIYFHSDTEFQRYLGLAAHAIHSHAYTYNTEILRCDHFRKDWTKKYGYITDDEGREVDRSMREMATLFFHAFMLMDNLVNLIGLTPAGLKVLLYLYQAPNAYIERKVMEDEFAGFVSKQLFLRTIVILTKGGFIVGNRTTTVKKKGAGVWRYGITASGIRVVNNFFQQVRNKNVW